MNARGAAREPQDSRAAEARRAPAFVQAAEAITEIFLARGVLRGAAVPPIQE